MNSSVKRQTFSVDARLLSELGERLVGQPHIALSELIKNSYDADATIVRLTFAPDRITVEDNGHGMSSSDFAHRWMRIGTGHKEERRTSPRLGRVMTGSKGVGRLAVQMLARGTRIESVALKDPARPPEDTQLEAPIAASISWNDAAAGDDITSFAVPVVEGPDVERFAGDSSYGTRVILTDLVHAWDAEAFEGLAREVWSLQPPFEVENEEDPAAFAIEFDSASEAAYKQFSRQMSAILDIWEYRIKGELIHPDDTAESGPELPSRLPDAVDDDAPEGEDGAVGAEPAAHGSRLPDKVLRVTVTQRGQEGKEGHSYLFSIPNCEIDQMTYDIRVFDLRGRQPHGVTVGTAREYLRRFGGVVIYDEGFRLPYYGPEDWLSIQRDQARRLSTSRLLPEDLIAKEGLRQLPSQSRIFGEVFISTAHEQRNRMQLASAEENSVSGHPVRETGRTLTIQVTRDRLVDNAAYRRLIVLVRTGVELYAQRRAELRAAARITERLGSLRGESTSETLGRFANTVERVRPQLPSRDAERLAAAARDVAGELESRDTALRDHTALLGALATAGMTSIAYEHEISRQTATIEELLPDLRAITDSVEGDVRAVLQSLADALEGWAARTVDLRELFQPLMDEESRTKADSYNAKSLVDSLVGQLDVLNRGIPVDTEEIPDEMMLPAAPLPAWTAMLQNLLINAFNALVETADPKVAVFGRDEEVSSLSVQDNGVGVDLGDSERLWLPFERQLELPPHLKELNLGGTGLGLTIVRMIGETVGVEASFETPSDGFTTAVELKWTREGSDQ